MRERFLEHIKRMYLYACVYDKQALYEQMEKDMPITISYSGDDLVSFNFGSYNGNDVVLTYQFTWEKKKHTTSMGKEMTSYYFKQIS